MVHDRVETHHYRNESIEAIDEDILRIDSACGKYSVYYWSGDPLGDNSPVTCQACKDWVERETEEKIARIRRVEAEYKAFCELNGFPVDPPMPIEEDRIAQVYQGKEGEWQKPGDDEDTAAP